MTQAATTRNYRKRLGYHAGLLGAIALLTSAALVFGNLRTHKIIAQRLAEDMRASLQQVIPARLYDNNPLQDTASITPRDKSGKHDKVKVYIARKAGHIAAFAYEVTGQGYGGLITLIMGVDPNGKILGVRVISHHETPGLGDRIEAQKSHWIFGFTGRSLDNPKPDKWKVKKDGGYFDQFSGATITPRAVVKAVHYGLKLFAQHRTELLGETKTTNNKPAAEVTGSHPSAAVGTAVNPDPQPPTHAIEERQ